MRNICCFAGHGKMVYGEDIRKQVFNKCRELVLDFGVNEFWVGNYGGFDALAGGVIRELKKEFSGIELNLIIPYLTKNIDTHREKYYKDYDNILIAQIPMSTPKRYQILKCNQ